MKLRIRGNSIRLRLLRGEVARFGADGAVRETIDFGAAQMTYVLQREGGGENLSAVFDGGQITVFVPEETAREWTETDLITLENEQILENGETLKILVEKDFVCLDRPHDEDNRDAYPNTSHKC